MLVQCVYNVNTLAKPLVLAIKAQMFWVNLSRILRKERNTEKLRQIKKRFFHGVTRYNWLHRSSKDTLVE